MGSPEQLGAPPSTADVFCKIVDNLGDAGIAWRIARGLAQKNGFRVRLFIDDLLPLARIKPKIDPDAAKQKVEDVSVFQVSRITENLIPADLVIEVLAAELPKPYLEKMAAQDRKPVWILYEYLSAEAWVEKTHLLPSPHPALPLTRHFFYPGFSVATGGLLDDSRIICPEPSPQLHRIFLFGYENKLVLKDFLACLKKHPAPVALYIPEEPCLKTLEDLHGRKLADGESINLENLKITPLPFVDQDVLIENLATYDLNIVRGEDSLTLAVLTGRPLIWHIYPQEEGIHLNKLNAFLDHYTASLSIPAAEAVRNLNLAWNGQGDITAAWQSYLAHFIEISKDSEQFAKRLRSRGSALEKLVDFFRQNR